MLSQPQAEDLGVRQHQSADVWELSRTWRFGGYVRSVRIEVLVADVRPTGSAHGGCVTPNSIRIRADIPKVLGIRPGHSRFDRPFTRRPLCHLTPPAGTWCMVAEPGPDVRIWHLTCNHTSSSIVHPTSRTAPPCPDWHRLRAVRAPRRPEYIPKFWLALSGYDETASTSPRPRLARSPSRAEGRGVDPGGHSEHRARANNSPPCCQLVLMRIMMLGTVPAGRNGW